MAKLNEAARDRIPVTKFAFPKQRKEPLENASHVRNAAARFNQVEVSPRRSAARHGSGSRQPPRNSKWNSRALTPRSGRRSCHLAPCLL